MLGCTNHCRCISSSADYLPCRLPPTASFAPCVTGKRLWNSRYNAARNFLNYQMARHSVRHSKEEPTTWLPKLFLLDIDGVFDLELFGPLFQHTTLTVLQRCGSQIPRLFRGAQYRKKPTTCEKLLPNRFTSWRRAEYGSAFFDAIQNIDLPLIERGGAPSAAPVSYPARRYAGRLRKSRLSVVGPHLPLQRRRHGRAERG